jgi:hypothetical protein
VAVALEVATEMLVLVLVPTEQPAWASAVGMGWMVVAAAAVAVAVVMEVAHMRQGPWVVFVRRSSGHHRVWAAVRAVYCTRSVGDALRPQGCHVGTLAGMRAGYGLMSVSVSSEWIGIAGEEDRDGHRQW